MLIVVQRFRSDLGLFVHLHALATEGCFEAVGDEDARFLPIEQLSHNELVRVLERLHSDLAEHLDDEDKPPDEAVAACVQLGLLSSAPGVVLTEAPPPAPMLVSGLGMQLHAAVTVNARPTPTRGWSRPKTSRTRLQVSASTGLLTRCRAENG